MERATRLTSPTPAPPSPAESGPVAVPSEDIVQHRVRAEHVMREVVDKNLKGIDQSRRSIGRQAPGE
ncbi:MAG: hypothetical protein KGJ62_14845 [Armatimonadetes bacterium]|nr:hypothetical protein [Armatimonadota bacterium]MDE2206184.1 hypothetical protein [Armatimonadota bacterium]